MTQQPITDDSWSKAERMPRASVHDLAPRGSRRHEILTRAFEDAVLPRLLATRRQAAPSPASASPVGAGHVERLLGLVLTGTQAEAVDYVACLRDGGLPVAAILLGLLTPVARQLGCMWEDDTCSFSEVTIGIGRLMHVLRTVGEGGNAAALQAGPHALLVQMPGEQHGLGLSMVVHFFRQGGWRVRQAPSVTSAGLVGLVQQEWFGIVGISVACSDRLDALAGEIRAIRKHARNRDIGVMVGGQPFLAHPQLAALVGADATALDGQQALKEANRLVGMRARGQ